MLKHRVQAHSSKARPVRGCAIKALTALAPYSPAGQNSGLRFSSPRGRRCVAASFPERLPGRKHLLRKSGPRSPRIVSAARFSCFLYFNIEGGTMQGAKSSNLPSAFLKRPVGRRRARVRHGGLSQDSSKKAKPTCFFRSTGIICKECRKIHRAGRSQPSCVCPVHTRRPRSKRVSSVR